MTADEQRNMETEDREYAFFAGLTKGTKEERQRILGLILQATNLDPKERLRLIKRIEKGEH
jgi:hypothetical protein